ncbi:hypothetical protein [Gluconobacter morbifer]|uniref:UrcA family protein n=1 Tax=Gluconobacter morbifer G707 TaxID=1088869 RepID=G6XJX0_9PROT|nr:hypothetical protein [Gluconobacter morbifer]EHH67932.1 hypothetical protein GMO_16990 [Gluconobacter morbifer G707]
MRPFLISPVTVSVICLMGCLAAAPVVHPVTPLPVSRTDGVISVTSDSMEYCLRLKESVDRHLATPHAVSLGAMEDARHLRREGDLLCAKNHVRAGIERLRRALILLEHGQEKL